ncbi:MAG: BON domain-containing protein [Gammaproteobacteria bacterium]
MRLKYPVAFVAALAAAGVGLSGCHQKSQSPSQQMQQGANQMAQGAQSAGNQMKQVVSDSAITAKIKAKLAANSGLSSLNIHVETNNGVVTLSGTVGTDAQLNLANQIALDTDGVKGVENQIQVQSGG